MVLALSSERPGAPTKQDNTDDCHAGEWIADEVSIAYGGVAPKTIMAPKVQAAIKGQPWTGETLKKALQAVAEDVNITPNAPGTSQLASLPAAPPVPRDTKLLHHCL